MLAFEALTTVPKASILSSGDGEEISERNGGISFAAFLKGIVKPPVVLASGEDLQSANPEDLQITDDPKAMLLALLKEDGDTLSVQTDERKRAVESLQSENREFTFTPVLSEKLSINEMKYLLHKAKQYLKTKIFQADPNLKKEELPKSLKGLLQLADTLKIEIQKISFEQITMEEAGKTETKEKFKTATEAESEQEIETIDTERERIKKITTKISHLKEAPLFELKSKSVEIRHIVTTRQIIENRIKKEHSDKNGPKELLQTLLKRSENREDESHELFGAHARRNIANPLSFMQTLRQETGQKQQHKAEEKTLRDLLAGDISEHAKDLKTDLHKSADSLDVKLNEAKQTMKYLSQDIKKAIEEYKPPFSRVKVKLNPQRLGEVDITVVQRGKNVHINLSSNNAALNVLGNNLQELRTQLNHNGIHNATFNFNSDAQNQQQKEKEQNRREAYEYFSTEEESDEHFASLEIVIPRYI